MASRNFGKTTKTSSSSTEVPLIHRSGNQNTRVTQTKNPSSSDVDIPKKPITILRGQNTKYKKMSRKAFMEILMKQENPDPGKSVVVDVESDSKEIDETFNSSKTRTSSIKEESILVES